MSIIPSSAVTSVLSPLQAQSNEALRARKVQIEKNIHQAEDILELDDSAVDSVSDHTGKNQQDSGNGADKETGDEERVEIASLKPQAPAKAVPSANVSPLSHLDISA